MPIDDIFPTTEVKFADSEVIEDIENKLVEWMDAASKKPLHMSNDFLLFINNEPLTYLNIFLSKRFERYRKSYLFQSLIGFLYLQAGRVDDAWNITVRIFNDGHGSGLLVNTLVRVLCHRNDLAMARTLLEANWEPLVSQDEFLVLARLAAVRFALGDRVGANAIVDALSPSWEKSITEDFLRFNRIVAACLDEPDPRAAITAATSHNCSTRHYALGAWEKYEDELSADKRACCRIAHLPVDLARAG